MKSKFEYIDTLVNNAALVIDGEKQISELGYEMTLSVNHFGPFYLTYLLWGLVVKSAEGRVINVSSGAHYMPSDDYLEDL